MGMTKDELFEVLNNGLSESVIEIQDLAGDNDHYAVKIISNKFKGLSKINQHKPVYDVLGKRWAIPFMFSINKNRGTKE